jgi:hypothetical protein
VCSVAYLPGRKFVVRRRYLAAGARLRIDVQPSSPRPGLLASARDVLIRAWHVSHPYLFGPPGPEDEMAPGRQRETSDLTKQKCSWDGSDHADCDGGSGDGRNGVRIVGGERCPREREGTGQEAAGCQRWVCVRGPQ